LSRRTVGVDVGGTKVLAVAVDPAAPTEVLASARVSTPTGGSAIVQAIAEVVHQVDSDPTHEVGVGVAGLVDRNGVVWTSPNLRGVDRFDLRNELVGRLGRHVVIENDATAAAMAEARFGAGVGRTDVIFVALGTGIGGALVVDGQVRRGVNGFAGEFGHMIVERGGVRCVCGRRGCWERYASGAALERMAHDREQAGDWQGRPLATAISGEEIIEAARVGHPTAILVLDEFSGWIGLGVANLVAALDPQCVILGGGVLDAGDVLLEPIRSAVRASLFGVERRPDVEVVAATLGSMAGAVGAALLAAESITDPPP